MVRKSIKVAVATAVTAVPFFAFAERPELEYGTLYGISQNDGALVRYDIYTDTTDDVGKVQLDNGKVLTGIRAAAYKQGYRTMVAFWTDEDDGRGYAVKVDLETGESELCPNPLVEGSISGATAVRVPNASGEGNTWSIYALTQRTGEADDTDAADNGAAVSGVININPNNSPDNAFELDFADGTTVTLTNGQIVDGITRDDLKDNLERDAEGVVFRGDAQRVHIKPKGNGNNNSMTMNGEDYAIQNGTTYEFEGTMQVVVWNDHINKKGKAMGKWWISIDATDGVTLNGEGGGSDADPSGVLNHLVKVDPDTGVTQTIMTLGDSYDSLAGEEGGEVFYASKAGSLYRIDTTANTVVEVGAMSGSETDAMEVCGGGLRAFKETSNKATQVDTDTGGWSGGGYSIDADALGTMIYVDPAYDPTKLDQIVGYD